MSVIIKGTTYIKKNDYRPWFSCRNEVSITAQITNVPLDLHEFHKLNFTHITDLLDFHLIKNYTT